MKYYKAEFENGAEYNFFAPRLSTAEKVAEKRALELETKVKELIETSKNVPTTKVIEPWVGTRFEVNEEGSIAMVVHFATPKMPQIKAALLDAQIIPVNIMPWTDDDGQVVEIVKEVPEDTNVLHLSDWVKKVSAFISLVEEKVDAEKALEEFIKDVFEDED